jgi:hypothetical protein
MIIHWGIFKDGLLKKINGCRGHLKDFGVDLLERPDSSLKPFKKDRWLIRRN